MDRKSDDGSRFYQQVTREYVLPESMKVEGLKSILTDDGVTLYFLLIKLRLVPLINNTAPYVIIITVIIKCIITRRFCASRLRYLNRRNHGRFRLKIKQNVN